MKKIINISFFSRSRIAQDPIAGSFYGWHSQFGRALSRDANFKDFQIECWSPDIAVKKEVLYEKDTVRYRVFPGTFCIRPGREISLPLIRELRQECEKHTIIIQLHDFHNWQAYAICAMFKNIPLVVQDHGATKVLSEKIKDIRFLPFLPILLAEYLLEKKLANRVFCFLAPNSARVKHFQRIGASKTQFCPMAADAHAFFSINKDEARRKFEIPEKQKLLLHVGGFTPYKNLELLVSVFAGVAKAQPAYLIIAGPDYDISYRNKIVSLFKNRGLLDRVKIVNNIDKQKLNLLYNAADALLVTSREEGGPTVTLEALAVGTPVVSTEVGFARDFERASVGMLSIASPRDFISAVLGVISRAEGKNSPQLIWSSIDMCNLYASIYRAALR